QAPLRCERCRASAKIAASSSSRWSCVISKGSTSIAHTDMGSLLALAHVDVRFALGRASGGLSRTWPRRAAVLYLIYRQFMKELYSVCSNPTGSLTRAELLTARGESSRVLEREAEPNRRGLASKLDMAFQNRERDGLTIREKSLENARSRCSLATRKC